MNQASDEGADDGAAVAERGPELVVAILLVVFSLGVIADSLRVGIGWADDGPRSGYFPFYIGLLLLGASLSVLVGVLRRWGGEGRRPFAAHAQLASVLAVLLPMAVYVGGVAALGMYLPSALLIGWFMRRHGGFGWLASVVVSVAVPVVFFLVFERWFLVPLPKGPLERLLGF